MIGQKRLISIIDRYIANKSFPRFSIIIGEEGAGKHTLCEYISSKLQVPITYVSNKIDDIKDFISDAEMANIPYLFVIEDGNQLSPGARNAILKVIEEPPALVNIILLSTNKEYLIPTIRSRGVTFELDPYSKDELVQIGGKRDEEALAICDFPGDYLIALESGCKDMVELATKIIDKLGMATLPNALTITHKMKLSDNPDGFDIRIFMNCISKVLADRLLVTKDKELSAKLIKIYDNISYVKSKLNIKSVNKKFTFDQFIINSWEVMR